MGIDGVKERKMRLYYCFFRSTVVLTVVFQVISVLCLFFSLFADQSEPTMKNACLSCLPMGLVLDLLYKELTYKETYYFYYNQGIRKGELWIFSFCGWLLLFVCIFLMLCLCANVWKLIV